MTNYENSSDSSYSQMRFQNSKRRLWYGLLAIVLISIPLFACVSADQYVFAFVIGIFWAAAIQMTYRMYEQHREVLIFDDRIEIVNFSGALIKEIYYSDIKNAGVMTNTSDIHGPDDTGDVHEDILVILLRDKTKEIIESDVSNLDQLSAIIQEKIGDTPSPNLYMHMDATYIERFKTGRKPILASGFMAALMLLATIIVWLYADDGLLPITIIACIAALGTTLFFLRRYREMLLYSDRMQVVSLFDGVINEIRYRDIKHIGFLHGYSNYGDRTRIGGSSVSVGIAELVILLNNGGRQQFIDEDFDHLDDVCAFIKEKIGQVEQVF